MKCPHCGMNIRDNVTECGYCGGAVTPQTEMVPAGGALMTGKAAIPELPEMNPDSDEEEEGGLSRILQPGEQVLIGALNVTVKKFFFHAYLTSQRIFLIDTQEKKIKVTAKDIPRSTIVGTAIESSENSDPVLVLSLKSADEDIKTLKLVFVQNGMDRSDEIGEWVSLLGNGQPKKKAPRRQEEAPVPAPRAEAEQKAVPPKLERPVQRHQELHPARKPPAKQLEKQAPVKRLLSMYNVPEEEPQVPQEPSPVQAPPQRRAQVRQVYEHGTQSVGVPVQEPAVTPEEPAATAPAPKPEVQSAMKVAMKSAMRPLQQPHTKPVRRTITSEPVQELPPTPPRRPVVHEPVRETRAAEEEGAVATPQFCHNCGKKLPPSANFCPGCGTKLSQSRTLPQNRPAGTVPDRRMSRTDPPVQDTRPQKVEGYEEDDDEGGETPVVARPPIKKAPKGSEMTILHKFLRR